MTTKRYCVFLIPAGHKPAANVAMALVNGDDPQQSDSFSVAANPSGAYADPATHYYGGMPVTEEWLSQVSNLATDMVALPAEMTWGDYDLTEADAATAAEAIYLQVTITQDGSEPDPHATLNNALAALGLKEVQRPT